MGKKKRTWFPHFHTHDEHSIKDGCSTVETYADIVCDLKGGSLAITNHGMAAGYARQYFACKERGIKPVFGMEAYVNEHRLKPIRRLVEELKKQDKAKKGKDKILKEKLLKATQFRDLHFRPSPHAIILAKNREGYRNLVKMSSDSFARGLYYKPRTDTTFLADHREGLIYSTACIGGYIPRIARNDFSMAVHEARRLKGIFGDDFYVELMMTEYEAQRETNAVMMKLAHEIGAPMIVTCDVHYAKKQDGIAQDVLLLMRDKKTMADKEKGTENVWQFEAKDLWWRTLEDVLRCWKDHHSDYMDKETMLQAIRNTYALDDKIEDMEFSTDLKLPGVFKNPEATLKELVISGFKERVSRGQAPAMGKTKRDYAERIHRELQVINAKGFAEYFLILHDICKAARGMGSRMGPGRGSAGGSLIAYLARITEIDPLRFDLLFERFLDENRPDPPDIDLDFSPEHRDEIKSYVEKSYPATATIGAFSTFKPRATIQDVARVYGLDYRDVLKVTKPMGTDADKLTWDQVFELWPEVSEFAEENPDAFAVIKTLKGLISHRGKNAAGMLIAPASALDEIPMITESDGQTVTAFADSQGDGVDYKGRELTRLGYLKADLLAVRGLNIAPQAIEILARDKGVEIDMEELPLDDPKTLEVASTGDVPGVFQLDTVVTRPILRVVGVDEFSDLVMVTALARPGPLKHAVHRQYARLKRQGDAWKEGIHPDLVHRLRDSNGLMILQEDVMYVVQVMGGLTATEANALRKIISKKHPEAIKLWRDRFVNGGLKKGFDKEILEEIWNKIVTFAGYGFCKAHAVAYILTAYRQIYMLAHHPTEYFAALLAHTPRAKKGWRGEEKLTDFMRAAMARETPILGPSVLTSGVDFDVEEDSIRFGLSKIKGVASAAEAVVAARPFSTLEEFFEKIPKRTVNLKVMTNLIYAGAFDDVEFDPAAGPEVIPEEDGVEYRNGILLRYHQLKKTKEPPARLMPAVLRQKERELLGIALSWWSGEEKDDLREQEGLETITWCLEQDVRKLHLLAEVTRMKTHKSRRGTMAFLSVGDETGTLENITLWAEQWKHHKDSLKQGRVVVIRLKRQENRDQRYGKYSYHLDTRADESVVSAQRAMRRNS